MKRFASNTRVPIERSRAEIERVITRYGASRLMTAYIEDRAIIAFELKSRRVRFVLPTPDRAKFKRPDSYDKEHRRLWRAFALVIKAQLEAVASGVFSFEDIFGMHILLQNGKTIGETITPRLAAGTLLLEAGA
jgi:hypothetical protein